MKSSPPDEVKVGEFLPAVKPCRTMDGKYKLEEGEEGNFIEA